VSLLWRLGLLGATAGQRERGADMRYLKKSTAVEAMRVDRSWMRSARRCLRSTAARCTLRSATMGPWLLSARAMVCLLLMLVLLVQAAGGQGTACTFDIAGTFRSFQLSHGCGVATPAPPSPAPPAPAQALTYYVAAKTGSDQASGRTPRDAWKTLSRVLQEMQVLLPVSARPPVVASLLPGRFDLGSAELALQAVHAGLTVQAALGAEGLVSINGSLGLSCLD
jgi:hypothetical protein